MSDDHSTRTHDTESPWRGRFPFLSRLFAGVVTLFGALTLLGWITGSEALKSLAPSGITVKTNTSIALLLSGLGLLLLVPVRRSALRTILGRACALVAGSIGLATLTQHLFGWDLGIDQLLFREESGSPATLSPNRMGPPASVTFPLIGLALLLLDRRRGAPWQPFALTAILLCSIPLLGYVYGATHLYGIARLTGIAFHTAVAFVLLGAGILMARPDRGLMRRVSSDDPGGLLLRRILPAALVLPVLLGYVREWGERAGLYDDEFGLALHVLGFILLFSFWTWRVALALSGVAAARARAETAGLELRDRLVRTERAAREAAEHSNRVKDDFLATLSHELRTPLNAILGWSMLLGRSNLDAAETRRGLEAIERNARLQARLIEDLLDMSRIVSGQVRLDLQDVDLPVVLDNVLLAAQPGAEARGIRLTREIEPAVPPVRGDAARIQQVLWNLLSNALKFTARGGRVTVRLRRDANGAELAVSDDGIGIAPEFLPHVFDRFRQADASTTRRHGGLGLGLAISRQLAELHGGTLTAHSEGVGRGATFILRLPAADPADVRRGANGIGAADPPADAARGTGLEAPDLEGVKVLLVEDQPDTRELLERMLRERRADVRTTDSHEGALAALARERFDVLVSDIGMPGRDGYELVRAVRERHGPLPAIALTAFARDEDRRLALEAGFQVHLAKPVHPDRLASAVRALAPEDRRASAGTDG